MSVVVPTYNRVDRLKRVLAALEKQSYPLNNFEVVVISDGSVDGTIEYLNELKTPLNLRFFQQKNLGVAAARNTGYQMAYSDLILFLDDDVVPETHLVYEHIQTHATYGSRCVVIGPMLPPLDFQLSPWVQWEQDKLLKQYQAMLLGSWDATARQFYTGNTSIERKYLLESGGFDPQFRRAEDVELAYRLMDCGLFFVFNHRAIGYHYAERTFSSWLQTPYIYGRNDVIFTKQKGQVWLLPEIFNEFYTRHFFIQLLTSLTLCRPVLAGFLKNLMMVVLHLEWTLKSHVLSGQVCSGLFNMIYYQGVADELGGRKLFEQGLKTAKQGHLHIENIALE